MLNILKKLQGTFSGLLLALIIYSFFQATLSKFFEHKLFIDLIFILIFVTAVLGLCDRKNILPFAIAFALPGLISRWLYYVVGENSTLVLFGQLSDFFFLIFISILIVYRIVRAREVTYDVLAGAVSAYLLIGVAFARLYTAVAINNSAAFRFPEEVSSIIHTPAIEQLLLYYSFVTLTTLGFGDITPLGDLARSLTVLEAVVGQMFNAILIARLVGAIAPAKFD